MDPQSGTERKRDPCVRRDPVSPVGQPALSPRLSELPLALANERDSPALSDPVLGESVRGPQSLP